MSQRALPFGTAAPQRGVQPFYQAPVIPTAELTLAEVTALVRRRYRAIALSILGALAMGVAFTLYARPVYEATSVLRFEEQQVNLPQLLQELTNENRISTEIEVLQGRSAALAVIDSLGLRAKLTEPRKGRITRLFSMLRVSATADTATLLLRLDGDSGYAVWKAGQAGKAIWARIGDTVQVAGVTLALSRAAIGQTAIRLQVDSPNDAVRNFSEALQVTRPLRDAELIDIRFRSNDPALSAAAANQLAEHLIASRRKDLEAKTGTAVMFLRQQLDSLRGQLQIAEDTLRRYREKAGAVDPDEQAKAGVGRLSQIQADRGTLEAERSALATLIAEIHARSALSADSSSPYRRLIAFPTLLKNQAAAELLNSLNTVENERAALLVRRTKQDPDVQVLTARIWELDRQLETIAETYLQGLTNQVAALDHVARGFDKALDSLPGKEVHSARLDRDAKVLQDLYALVQTRLKEAEITRAMQDPTMEIVDSAAKADRPVRPKLGLNLALSLLLGCLLGGTISIARELTDRSVRSRAELQEAAGLPVLGAMPRVATDLPRRHRTRFGRRKRPAVTAGDGPAPTRAAAEIAARLVTRAETPYEYLEAFNQLHTNLALAFQDRPLKVLLFTSALPGEGKTLSAVNYALTAASRRMKVLLIDADLRCGLVNQVFRCSRKPGFSEVLAGTARFTDAARRLEVGDGVSLVVLPSGALTGSPRRMPSMDKLREGLRALTAYCDLIVIDSPPVNVLPDAALLGAAADGVVLVVRAGRTDPETLRFAMEQLDAGHAPVVGTLLNDIHYNRSQYYEGRYRYLAKAESADV